jgi:alpha-2-macroglobulin
VHLMLEARDGAPANAAARPLNLPPDLLQKGIEYLQQLAASNPADLSAARNRAYAIYLLTRNGAVTTPWLSSLRDTLDAKYAAVWKLDATASFMAASYQLLKQDKAAAELVVPMVKQLEAGSAVVRYAAYYDATIRDAQLLYLLARHFPVRMKELNPQTFSRFVTPLANGRYNTLSSSWAILAIDAMAASVGSEGLGKLSVLQVDAKGAATAVKLPANLLPRAAFDAGTVKLKLANDSPLNTWYAVTQSGFDRTPPTTELKAGLEVVREYVGADGKPTSSVKIGDEITVRLSLRGILPTGASAGNGAGNGDAYVGSVALTDLLPGGFEVVQQRDANGAPNTVSGAGLEFADVREDRVVVYASATDAVQTYSYRLRATNLGEFTVPPAWAQGMYERERQARSLAGRVVVAK